MMPLNYGFENNYYKDYGMQKEWQTSPWLYQDWLLPWGNDQQAETVTFNVIQANELEKNDFIIVVVHQSIHMGGHIYLINT